MTDREAIRSNAKYLRSVRPIDPEEIAEYVPGGSHPAVVARVLREEAYDLGLVERSDGRFVPVDDDPVRPGWAPDRLPEHYERVVRDRLVERFGTDWHHGDSGDRLRETIREFKQAYLDKTPVEYDVVTALGYAIYHLPDYYATVGYVLDDLAETGLLGRRLRVLDVGAGVGGPALGLHDYLFGETTAESEADAPINDDGVSPPVVDYHAVEPSPAADLLGDLVAKANRSFRPTIHRETAEAFDPTAIGDPAGDEGDEDGNEGGPFDLVVFANVLSELDDPAAVLDRYCDAVASDGAVLAVAPADEGTSTGLSRTVRTVEDRRDLTVYAPDVRLWPGRRPTDRGWSFAVRPEVSVPSIQRRLDEPAGATGEFVNVDIQYTHSILRFDGKRRTEVTADSGRVRPLGEADDYVTERVDLLAVKLSENLAAEGNPLYRIGDGSQETDQFAVLTTETTLNDGLRSAEYGDLLAFESALVLWNDDESAYNVVVDDATIVDAIPAPV